MTEQPWQVVTMTRWQRLVVTAFVLCTSLGCASHNARARIESSAKNAYIMYSQQRQSLGEPSPHWYKYVDSEIGRKAFVDDLSRLVTTKYRAEALYALGWFGDDRQASLIANTLDDTDPEVLRIALSSFCRLTEMEFADAAQAREWWERKGAK